MREGRVRAPRENGLLVRCRAVLYTALRDDVRDDVQQLAARERVLRHRIEELTEAIGDGPWCPQCGRGE
jgi:hypothetical protein